MPSPKLIHFVVCEDARVDSNGLLSVNGLIWAPISASGPGALPKIALVLTFAGMSGVQRSKMTINVRRDSEPVLHAETDWQTRSPTDPDFHAFIQNVAPFPVPGAGSYTIRVGIDFGDGRSGIYTHGLRVDMPPGNPPAPPNDPRGGARA